MGDHRRHMSVAEAATILKIAKSTVRRNFDAAGPTAGERDPDTGERLVAAAWVRDQLASRRERQTRTVPASLSVSEAAKRLGKGKNTVRRWFDRDQPRSGVAIEGGRTGGVERRCSAAWVEDLASGDAPFE